MRFSRLFTVAALLGACTTGSSQATRVASGGPAAREGGSCANPVVIEADREAAGASAERAWLDKHHPGSTIQNQTLISCSGKQVDLVLLRTSAGEQIRVYFDISRYYGKF